VNVEVNLQKPLPALTADPVKLTGALTVLLTGVIRSSHLGARIELLVSSRSDHLAVTLRYQSATDAADVLRSLFHSSQADRPRRGLTDERIALALAQVKRIVEAHHGTVQFEAGEKRQSTVTLRLPVSAGAKSRERPALEKKKGGGTSSPA